MVRRRLLQKEDNTWYSRDISFHSHHYDMTTIMDKSPCDSNAIFIFSVISRSLIKQCILLGIFLQFFLPPPLPQTKLNSEEILDTRVQYFLWGEGRGWTCVNWKTPHQCKSVPRLTFVYDCRLTLEEPGCLYSPRNSVPSWSLRAVLARLLKNRGIFLKKQE